MDKADWVKWLSGLWLRLLSIPHDVKLQSVPSIQYSQGKYTEIILNWEFCLSLDRYSIEIGSRLIDCAKIYLNEKEVGEVLNEVIGNKVKRDDLFIVGKVSFGQQV